MKTTPGDFPGTIEYLRKSLAEVPLSTNGAIVDKRGKVLRALGEICAPTYDELLGEREEGDSD